MKTRPFRSWLLLVLAVVPLLAARAHFCGQPELRLAVGETLMWRITADMTETQTVYTPTIGGSNGVARIFPNDEFLSRHGDFILTGLAPGTNTLQVKWLYLGNGVSGTCQVSVIVEPNRFPVRYSSAPAEGSLVTFESSVPADTFRSMIDRFIPAESQKLLVLTECYAGNISRSPSFANAPNTCILSATVPDQTGKYGGYHDDAARALKPGAGRTALTVHTQGVKGKMTARPPPPGHTNRFLYLFENSEWPITGGTLSPEGFSLEPITADSAVQSRHIVIFMGDPGGTNINVEVHGDVTVPLSYGFPRPIYDNDDRDAIIRNFAGQPNTTVVTAGGAASATDGNKGRNGWEHPGSSIALSRAIRAAGDAIRNSENPAREQFILFVGDHGGTGYYSAPFRTNSPPGGGLLLPGALALPGGEDALYDLLAQDPAAVSRLQVQVELRKQPRPAAVAPAAVAPSFAPGSFSVTLDAGNGNEFVLSEFTQTEFDWDEDGALDSPGEYLALEFPISSADWRYRFAGKEVKLRFNNRSATDLDVTRYRFDFARSTRTSFPVPPPRIKSLEKVGNQLRLNIVALQLEQYAVEYSADLKSWSQVWTYFPLTDDSTLTLNISSVQNGGAYRLRWVPAAGENHGHPGASPPPAPAK
jgi:hypothetical protein